MEQNKAIAVFDSGVGGIPVLARAKKALPQENFIYYADTANFPYGDKDAATVKKGVENAMAIMVQKGIKAAIIACNTATSIAIKDLRQTYSFPILGMEPAIKPAAEHARGKKVAVIATPLTLKEEKFLTLLEECPHRENILPIPASGFADLVENGNYSNEKAKSFLQALFNDVGRVDSIVLGCTHYLYTLPLLKEMFPKAEIIDGGEGTVKHLCHILTEQNLLKTEGEGALTVLSSDEALFLPKFQEFFAAISAIIDGSKSCQ